LQSAQNAVSKLKKKDENLKQEKNIYTGKNLKYAYNTTVSKKRKKAAQV